MQQYESIAHDNKTAIANLSGIIKGIDQRVTALENANNVLVDVQKSLVGLTAELKFNGEKIVDLKDMIKQNNSDNKAQHDELSSRSTVLESLNRASAGNQSWASVVLILITAGITYLLSTMGLEIERE